MAKDSAAQQWTMTATAVGAGFALGSLLVYLAGKVREKMQGTTASNGASTSNQSYTPYQ